MARHVLITGGAGFIGSHVADELLQQGCRVRALDNLCPQVHGAEGRRPYYLHPDVELIIGDVRNPEVLRKALAGIDAVYHFAATVGVGQSMHELARYTEVNTLGTALLLEALIERPVERLVVASSMSVYGEGLYRAPDGSLRAEAKRDLRQLRSGDWEPRDARGEALTPVPTPESKRPSLASVYALSKFDQESLCLMAGRAYAIPTVALRFFNTYGPRQALSNPYTGVLAIFAARLLNDKAPLAFEDGEQTRDFVSVHDVARACRLALEAPRAAGQVFNVGSGQRYTIRHIAERTARILDKQLIDPEITGSYRMGDIRHCYADLGRAREALGFEPCVTLDEGLVELATWLEGQVALDGTPEAQAELAARGLTICRREMRDLR